MGGGGSGVIKTHNKRLGRYDILIKRVKEDQILINYIW